MIGEPTYWIVAAVIVLVAVCVALYFTVFRRKKVYEEFYEDPNRLKRTCTLVKCGSEKEYLKDGEERVFYPTGELNKTITWVKGKKNGPFTIFYKSGEKYITGSYANDSLVGDYYVFDKDSKVIKSFKY
jgi:antitoxin component YwqK of YwqJK toxin-antitoxin module